MLSLAISQNNSGQSLNDTISQHRYTLACLGIVTICYHIIRKYRKGRTSSASDKTSEEPKMHKKVTQISSSRFISFDSKARVMTYNPNYHVPADLIRSNNSLVDQLKQWGSPICKIQKETSQIPQVQSPLLGNNTHLNIFGGQGFLPQQAFVYRGSYVVQRNVFDNNKQLHDSKQWLLAGPRKHIFFKPSEVSAAIVTCGGLCPGLNVVIRQIFVTLSITYGCKQVWGVHFGYKGFYSGDQYWEKLDLSRVKELQHQGGTTLGSSRGGFLSLEKKKQKYQKEGIDPKDIPKEDQVGDDTRIVDQILRRGINQVYVIGGDGTHRGIAVLCQEMSKRKIEVSLVGVPKTIDNDIPIVDKTFGFETAVSESIKAIRSAYTESRGVDYGIGLVRLMGRESGFIAMQASNCSRDVDLCLVPEFEFDLYGTFGVLQYIYQQLKAKKHLVIVVAEGAGQGVRDAAKLKEGGAKDASGNIKLPDIGVFLKKQIVKYCDSRANQQKKQFLEEMKAYQNGQRQTAPKNPNVFAYSTLKYIDPAYMIRTVPASSYDRKLCAHLASSAVHGAMAGFTNFTVGHINGTPAMIPISALGQPKRIKKSNRGWQRLLAQTGQPTFINDINDQGKEEKNGNNNETQ